MAKKDERSLEIQALWRGMADTAPWRQLPGQVEDAVNVRLDVKDGAAVREPLQFIADLGGFTGEPFDEDGVYYWTALQGHFFAIGVKSDLTTEAIHAWKPDGTPMEVIDLASLANPLDTGFQYVPTGADADTLISTSSAGDTISVTNRRRQFVIGSSWSFRQALNYIRNGHQNPPSIDGGDGDSLLAPFGGAWNNTGSILYDPALHNFDTLQTVRDLTGGNRIEDTGQVCRITIGEGDEIAGFYVFIDDLDLVAGGAYPPLGGSGAPDSYLLGAAWEFFDSFPGAQQGDWYLIPDGRGLSGSGNTNATDDDNGQLNARIEPNNAPHLLVLDIIADVVYWIQPPWTQRVSGGQGTNRATLSQFTNVRDVSFFGNRLAMLGRTALSLSEDGQFFSFFADDELIDDPRDPINVDLGFDDIGEGDRMVVAGERLFINCGGAQIEFGSAGEALTSTNGRPRVLSRYQTLDVRLQSNADQVTIIDAKSNVRQYEYQNFEIGITEVGLINVHDLERWFTRTPFAVFQLGDTAYVPDAAGTAEPMLVYEQFIQQGRLIQSGWWKLIDALDSDTFLVYDHEDAHRFVQRDEDGYSLQKQLPRGGNPTDGLLFWPRLDRLERANIGTFNASTNRTAVTHTGRNGDAESSLIVLANEGQRHEILRPTDVLSDGSLEFAGDLTAISPVPYLGFDFESTLRLSPLFPGPRVEEPLILELYVFHHRSTDYKLFALRPDGSEGVVEWESKSAGVMVAGESTIETGYAELPSVGDGRVVRVELRHDGPGQAIWTALHYRLNLGGVN